MERRGDLVVIGVTIALVVGSVPVIGASGDRSARSGLPTDADASPVCGERDPHPPIAIRGDEGPSGFVLGHDPITGDPVYRPGSGVVAGNGTADDPYVIEGWCLGSPRSGAGVFGWMRTPLVFLWNTTAHVTIRDNRLSNWGVGIGLLGSTNVTAEDNELGALGYGISLIEAHGNEIRDNAINETAVAGVELRDTEDNGVHRNRVAENAMTGIALVRTSGTNVSANVVADNGGPGIEIEGGQGHEIRRNNIEDNGYGLTAEEVGATVDATENWWGCPDGPDDPGCDDVAGDVDVDPWLTSPNPDAGAT